MSLNQKKSTIVVIPARLGSTRLPNKPLADINGKPMIIHVVEHAKKADVDRIVVATDSKEIYNVVTKAGNEAILTPSELSSGTMRVGHAIGQIKEKYDLIINVQGDMPNIQPDIINKVKNGLVELENCDIMTAVHQIAANSPEIHNPNNVKAVLSFNGDKNYHRALYFSRCPVPFNAKKYYSHIGIYGFKADALQKFLELPKSDLETYESLEQLRALEYEMSIFACVSKYCPVSVDVPKDLENARKIMAWG